jgi:hypothetical protein
MSLTFSSVIKDLAEAPGGDLKSLGRKVMRVDPPSAPSASSAGISLDP